MARDYVQALLAALQSGIKPEVLFRNLESVLAGRGHSRLLPRILRTLEREVGRLESHDIPTLTVGRQSDATSPLVKELKTELGVTAGDVQLIIDETIIGGAILRAKSTEIDASYKTALITLYQTITK